MREPDHIMYLGPVRVPVLLNYYGGILGIASFETRTILGYPSMMHGTCVLRYNISHLHPHLQAAFRTPETCSQWSSYLMIGDEVWTGIIQYQWNSENEVLAHLIRQ